MRTLRWVFVMGTAATAAALLLASSRGALGEHKEVAGTKHDVATPGTPVCIYCHIPRDAAGQLLWPQGQLDTGSLSGEKRLCFSCHDGTVAPERSYVFDPASSEHPRNPGVEGQDCDRCHNPHGDKYGNFLKLPGGANFCWNCHFRAGPADHPIGVDAIAAGLVPKDSTWDPRAGDFSGTRLWNAAGTGPGNLVMCLTCHSPHGAQPGTQINTVLFAPEQGFFQALCENCHARR